MGISDSIWTHAETYRSELSFLLTKKEEMFGSKELAALDEVEQLPDAIPADGARAVANLHLILKATRLCNLRCTYCHSWRSGPNQVMPFAMLARTIREGMRYPGLTSLYLIWHGGETTLLSRRYFQKALWLQEHFRTDDRKVFNAVQSNATMIDSEWGRFFAACGFSVGVSVDLCEAVHDRQRPFADGGGSWAATMAGLAALRECRVSHGALAVLNPDTVERGAGWFLDRLDELGIDDLGILNALPSNGETEDFTGDYLPWPAYVDFLRELYALSRRRSPAPIIRELDSLLGIVKGGGSRLCVYSGGCMGSYLTVEPNGEVSACDKYVGDERHAFGSLADERLADILTRSGRLARARALAERPVAPFAQSCPNFTICRGGCPHDNMLNSRFGHARTDCCGLHDLIEDMKKSAQELV